MLTFYLVRHGSTEGNYNSLLMGYRTDTPLTEEGLKNAKIVSEKLKGTDFDHVYSSDLGRAFITAYIIAENLEIESKLTRAKELREIDLGIYTLSKSNEITKKCPKYKKDVDYVFPEGESFSQMQKRVVNFIRRIEKKHPGETILVVTHVAVIRAIKCYFNHWDFQKHLNMRITHEYIGKFVIDKGKLFSYEKINE